MSRLLCFFLNNIIPNLTCRKRVLSLQGCTSPRHTKLPWQQIFVRLHQIFIGPEYGTCFKSHFWNFEVSSMFLFFLILFVYLFVCLFGNFMQPRSVPHNTNWWLSELSTWRRFVLIRSNKMQQYAGIYLLQNYSTSFGCPSHPSSGIHKTVTAASGTGHSI